MATFDEPSINVTKKSNEQNMSVVKSYLSNQADNLNYMERRITALESAVSELQSVISSLETEA